MGRRRSKSQKRRTRDARAQPTAGPAARQGAASTAESPASAPEAARPLRAASPPRGPATAAEAGIPEAASPLRPWRTRVEDLLDHLRGWAREHYGKVVEAFLEQYLGAVEGGADGTEAPSIRPEDIDRAVEDFVCSPGSAGEGRSILSVFAEQAGAPGGGPLDPEDRSQAQRWERERARGVFLLQHATRDRLTLWDPIEGAPLTLHLVRKISEARVGGLRRGTVVTATYQPWMARLVAVGEVEYFADARALALFREETMGSGTPWHEPPPPAPQPTVRRSR